MALTPQLRQGIDRIRDYLFGGGYPDPMSNAEQLSYLMFFYLIEGLDEDNKLRAKGAKKQYDSVFSGEWAIRNPLNAPSAGQSTVPANNLRWSVWARGMTGQALVNWMRDEVFPFYAGIAEQSATNFMDGARLGIDEPTVLTQIVNLLDNLHLDEADGDTKGDLFEHVLRQIKQAGELGQFRTPRHVIRSIVELVNPKIGETIYDPAAGTAGFLVAAYNHIRLANSSEHAIEEAELDGKRVTRGWGDKLSSNAASQLANSTFYGNDVDPKMVRLATMNLTLRGLPNVRILKRNALTTVMDRSEKAELGLPLDGYDIVLANPPFSGKLDRDRIVDDVKIGTSTATELLFLKYMLNMMKAGGRCGVVVPEGVLFGSTGAHKELRRQLVENNTVEAVLTLPGGVFQPYSGVKTSVIVFKKGGRTQQVQFLHADNDGYKMDAQHDTPVEADDLPALVQAFKDRAQLLPQWQQRDAAAEWTEKYWFASADELRENDFNLSAGRYRPMSKAQAEHRNPIELLDELRAIEVELLEEIDGLRTLLVDTK
jgi:type I restriction enzyme M protein